MNFKTLPADVVRRMLYGTFDELTPLAEARANEIKRTPCPRCGTSLSGKLAPLHSVFSPDDPLPRMMMHCQTCGFEGSTRTGVIYSTGDGRRVDDPYPTVKSDED